MIWYTYILECFDGTLYTGATNDLERRLKEHNSSKSKTKYTKVRQPDKLLKYFSLENKSQALKLEYQIKQLSRKEKLKLCQQ